MFSWQSLPGLTDTSISDAVVSYDHIAISTHTNANFEVHVFRIDTRTFTLQHLRTVNIDGEITCLALGHDGTAFAGVRLNSHTFLARILPEPLTEGFEVTNLTRCGCPLFVPPTTS